MGAQQEDVAAIGLADVTHRLEMVGHVLGLGGVLVAPVLAAMDGDARAATPSPQCPSGIEWWSRLT